MELQGSETGKVLSNAISGELKASFRYRYLANLARFKGMPQVADILEATALNEIEHARHEYEFLNRDIDILNTVEQAIKDETEETKKFYPGAASVAAQEGFQDIADFFARVGKVEGKHGKNMEELLLAIKSEKESKGKTVGHSAVEMAQLMLPDQANPAGFVHGGELMKLMDNAAGVVATRHSGINVVTGSVEDIKFLKPVKVGDLVMIRGKIVYTSRSSMEVLIEVESEELWSTHSGLRQQALSAYFIMVALDKYGKPTAIPSLIISTEEEERLFKEGDIRYKARRESKK
jgi:acyl-CoA hydrolase/ferritin